MDNETKPCIVKDCSKIFYHAKEPICIVDAVPCSRYKEVGKCIHYMSKKLRKQIKQTFYNSPEYDKFWEKF